MLWQCALFLNLFFFLLAVRSGLFLGGGGAHRSERSTQRATLTTTNVGDILIVAIAVRAENHGSLISDYKSIYHSVWEPRTQPIERGCLIREGCAHDCHV